MNKGFGTKFNKKNNNQNKDYLVKDIELSAQTGCLKKKRQDQMKKAASLTT